MTTSVILPIFNLVGYRKRNFDFILNRCLASSVDEIIIVEQVNKKSSLELPEDTRINHVLVDTQLNYVHKTLLCNVGASVSKGDYLIFNDADIYINLNSVIEKIDPENDIVIKPFIYFAKFDNESTEDFINKKTVTVKNCSVIHDFAAGCLIIKRENFLIMRGYDERYMGWGFEDKEFATRVNKLYDIKVLDFKGVHLYHEISTSYDILDRNSSLYRLAEKDIFIDINKYIKSIRSSLPYIRKVFTNKVHNDEKSKYLNKLITSAKKSTIKTNKNITQSDEIHIKPINHICHVTAPALLPDKTDLFFREQLTLESLKYAYIPFDIKIEQILITNSDYKTDFETKKLKRDSTEIGDTKGVPYLIDLLDQAADTGADTIVYTNSDCAITTDFYEFVSNITGEVTELHRLDVDGNIINLHDLFNNPNTLRRTGVDGLIMRTDFWLKYRKKIRFDFFIGEPHWDTSICGIFRRLGVSAYNTNKLYHINHAAAWNTKNLSPAGKHNDLLYREFKEYGLLETNVLTVPSVPDTACIMVHYGNDEIRINAIRKNLKMLQQQDLNTHYIFVEMVDGETCFPELKKNPKFKHIIIQSNDSNKNLWQKEALMNIGVKESESDYIIFVDSDVHSLKPDWFRRIRNKLREEPMKMVQGFRTCRDTDQPIEHSFVSEAAHIVFNYQCDLMHNPGMVWGITKRLLELNDYVNPYMIYGGGDSLFMYEYMDQNRDNKLDPCWISTFSKIGNIKRKLPYQAKIDCVDDDILHCNHGKVGSRNYKTRHYMTGYFTKEIKELVKINDVGLLEWIDPNCPERKMCMKRYEMGSIYAVRDICSKILSGDEQ